MVKGLTFQGDYVGSSQFQDVYVEEFEFENSTQAPVLVSSLSAESTLFPIEAPAHVRFLAATG